MNTDRQNVILEAEHIKTYYPIKGIFGRAVNTVKAVDDVSVSIYEGETLGLVGETGCGKSTLGRTLLRLVPLSGGTIRLMGRDITKEPEHRLRKIRQEMQMVFQDPYTSLNPRLRVGKALEEILLIHGVKTNRKEKVLEILSQVGLSEEIYDRYPHEFSGGQRQRIGLARALILNPRLLICDEPVSALDVSVQAQIVNLLCDIKQKRGVSCLFISHDISVVRHISDRIAVMYLGHIVEEAQTDELMEHPLHPYTKSLLSAVPLMDPYNRKKRIVLEGDVPSPMNPPSGCVFHTRCPYAGPICKTQFPSQRAVNENHAVCCHAVDLRKY